MSSVSETPGVTRSGPGTSSTGWAGPPLRFIVQGTSRSGEAKNQVKYTRVDRQDDTRAKDFQNKTMTEKK